MKTKLTHHYFTLTLLILITFHNIHQINTEDVQSFRFYTPESEGVQRAISDLTPCTAPLKKYYNSFKENSMINIHWEVLVPDQKGVCSVEINSGNPKDNEYKTLVPVKGSLNFNNQFKCGRKKNYEVISLFLPENFECKNCKLRFNFNGEFDDFNYCSRLTISARPKQCLRKCQNGGVCDNGRCRCKGLYKGEFCDEVIDYMFWIKISILILIGLAIIAVALAIYIYWDTINMERKKSKIKLPAITNDKLDKYIEEMSAKTNKNLVDNAEDVYYDE